jgi:hypothetical protein
MLEPNPLATQLASQGSNLPSEIRAGLEYRVLELIIKSYKKICAEGIYPDREEEERYSAILKDNIENYCPEYSRLTGQIWDVVREYYHDTEQVRKGQADPRKVPRIDIVISTWMAIGERKIKFPFECKLLAENKNELIKLYVKEGIIDRYLTEKDYSSAQPSGGMIGYILQGKHEAIVTKLNEQIDRLLNRSTDHLRTQLPIAQFEAIYRSLHQHPKLDGVLVITHLLLSFPDTSLIGT